MAPAITLLVLAIVLYFFAYIGAHCNTNETNREMRMKILTHGKIIVFVCPKCGCKFSEVSKLCYSSTGEDGAHYTMACPDCGQACWTTDELQKGHMK